MDYTRCILVLNYFCTLSSQVFAKWMFTSQSKKEVNNGRIQWSITRAPPYNTTDWNFRRMNHQQSNTPKKSPPGFMDSWVFASIITTARVVLKNN